jgi:peptidoglycan/LPS O-acetylase OafA/YrhL
MRFMCARFIDSRRRAFGRFTLLSILATGLIAAVPAANTGLSALLVLTVLGWSVQLLHRDGVVRAASAIDSSVDSGRLLLLEGTIAGTTPGSSQGGGQPCLASPCPPPRPSLLGARRLPFLDNLKVLLTVLVILHHAVAAFAGGGSLGISIGASRLDGGGGGGSVPVFRVAALSFLSLNQCFFMCLFFFVSGYFVPHSLARRGGRAGGGVRPFLRDKLKRLGLPWLAYTLLLGPGLGALAAHARRHALSYAPNAGQTWFLAWLIIFSFCYALVADDAAPGQLELPLPGLARLCAVGAALGVLQVLTSAFSFFFASSNYSRLTPYSFPLTLLYLLCGAALGVLQALQAAVCPSLVMMPITFGSFPFDVLFFVAGVAAHNSRWFEAEQFPAAAAACRNRVRLLTAALVVATYAGIAAMVESGDGFGLVPINECSQGGAPPSKVVRRADSLSTGVLLGALAGAGAFFGVLCMLLSWCLLDLFQLRFNSAGKRMRWLGTMAYSAYLVHGFVVVPLTVGFVAWLRATGHSVEFADGELNSTSCVGQQYLALGCALVAGLGVPMSFAFAACVRELPYLRDVM